MKGVIRCRPQFKPDGKLLTVTTNQITIKEVPVTKGIKNEEMRDAYTKLTDIILKFSEIRTFENDFRLANAFNNMEISKE